MSLIARALGHCTAHAAYEHDCPYCRDAELQVSRWSDVKTDAALAATLRGAVERIAELERLLVQANVEREDWKRWCLGHEAEVARLRAALGGSSDEAAAMTDTNSDNSRNWALYPARAEVEARGDDHKLVAIGPAVSGRVEVGRASQLAGAVEDRDRLAAWLSLIVSVAYEAEVREHAQRALTGESIPTDDGGSRPVNDEEDTSQSRWVVGGCYEDNRLRLIEGRALGVHEQLTLVEASE
jgi:hypothetical protein